MTTKHKDDDDGVVTVVAAATVGTIQFSGSFFFYCNVEFQGAHNE